MKQAIENKIEGHPMASAGLEKNRVNLLLDELARLHTELRLARIRIEFLENQYELKADSSSYETLDAMILGLGTGDATHSNSGRGIGNIP